MRQYVLCLAEANASRFGELKRVYGVAEPEEKVRDCNLGERTSLKARAFTTASAFRCWIKTRLWRRHRPEEVNKQAASIMEGREGYTPSLDTLLFEETSMLQTDEQLMLSVKDGNRDAIPNSNRTSFTQTL